MKKIGTITFHWATNFGAVLQAYALQQFLMKNGFETELIDYVPFQNYVMQRFSWLRNRNTKLFNREKAIRNFRKNRLRLSKKRYCSNSSLFGINDSYDAVISGSDQVMNFSFIEFAEYKKITMSYYLNFLGEHVKRISYAASFGSDEIPDKFKNNVLNELKKFSWVSVREQSAVEMLGEIGINSDLVVDPTLLLHSEDYSDLSTQSKTGCAYSSFILHNNQFEADRINDYLSKVFGDCLNNAGSTSVEEWLDVIRYSSFVFTNSFHAVVFSILFHTPFLVVGVEGSKMNGRLQSLLKTLNLEYRFIEKFDSVDIDRVIASPINWERVDAIVDECRETSGALLLEKLK